MRVVAAMSGGVDSAVAAALLKEQGFEVVGVTLRLYDEEPCPPGSGRGCCGSREARDAKAVAKALGIRHYTWDFRELFGREVVADFCAEYGRGRTPSPCLRCNSIVKFRLMLERVRSLGAGLVATGHYARVEQDSTGRWHLRTSVEAERDQTYFLYEMTQEQLGMVKMPLGEWSKSDVREKARNLGLPVAEKPDSQEVCFVPGGDLDRFLRTRQPEMFRPGPVVDKTGATLGEHNGLVAFTLGQRKGLGLALGERAYVVGLDTEKNTVVVGERADALFRTVEAGDVSWVAGRAPGFPLRCRAKVRSQGPGTSAQVDALPNGRLKVRFDEPQWAPASGQAVVFWLGDEVLGGGTIEAAQRE